MELSKVEQTEKPISVLSGTTEMDKELQIIKANKLMDGDVLDEETRRAIVFGKAIPVKDINKLALYKNGIDPFSIAKKVKEGLEAEKVIKKKKFVTLDAEGKPIFEEEFVKFDDQGARATFIKIANEMVQDSNVETGEKKNPIFNILINNDSKEARKHVTNEDIQKHMID